MRNAYKNCSRKTEWKTPLVRPRRRSKNTSKIGLKVVGRETRTGKVKKQTFVNMVMNIWVA